jgi:hypothetical protein
MTKVGFTGTQEGMTPLQKRSFLSVWQMIEDEVGPIHEFHHGDCVGADSEADDFAVDAFTFSGIGCVVIHPPDVDAKRAWCVGDRIEKPLPYLERNTEIVKACDVLIATPKEREEVLRSGTWATIRRARKYNKKLAVIFPDGVCRGLE